MVTTETHFTEITTDNKDGSEISRRVGVRGVTTCDFCGERMNPFDSEKCTDCKKDVCSKCAALHLPQTEYDRAKKYCPDCIIGKEPHVDAIKLILENQSKTQKKLKVLRDSYATAIDAFVSCDVKYLKDPKYQYAKQKFNELKASVEAGKYKSHKVIINKYRALLKDYLIYNPENTPLYRDINREIEDHLVDIGLGMMDQARHL